MDCCCITSVYSCVALLIGTTCTILFVYVVNLFCVERRSSTEATYSLGRTNSKGVTCQSVNCVRCNNDTLFKEYAKNRFINNFKSGTNTLLSRLENSILSNDKTVPLSDESRYVLFLRGLSTTVWFDPKLTHKGDTEKLENSFLEILEEFRSINNQDGWIINERKEGCWRVLHLVCQGKVVEENASRCPKTMNTVKSLDNAMCDAVFGYVTFSVMEPGTVISPHYGSTNCRVRCHLGLQVDPDTCYLEAGGQQNSWEVGKCLMFDDSFLHSAYHYGNKDSNSRAVLMVDMWHPGLNKAEIDCIGAIYTANLTSQTQDFH